MTPAQYRRWRVSTERFPFRLEGSPFGLIYPALKLNGEAGEVAEKVGKAWRDDTPLDKTALAHELGDVLWYVDAIAFRLGFTLGDLMDMNRTKITSRMARGVHGGSGDNR